MLSLLFLVLSAFLAWLAVDAWRLRGGSRIPYAQLAKLRGQSASHLSLQEQRTRQEYDEQRMTGNTNAMFLVFSVASFGSFVAALYQILA